MTVGVLRRGFAVGFVRASAAVLAVSFCVSVQAEERGHGAHVHGIGHLNVAIEGNDVEIELESPGMNIVGFEHAAKSKADKAAIKSAMASLKEGEKLFVFPAGAGCRAHEMKVEGPETHHDHGHHRHGSSESHTEFEAHYHFRCGNTEKLTHVDVKLFERFSRMEEIEAKVISSRGQRAQELTPKSVRLRF